MAKEVYGPYDSVEETVMHVGVLELKGFKARDINVIAKEDISKEIHQKIDAAIIGVLRSTKGEADEHLHHILHQFDMSTSQIERYSNAIANGEIIVIIDNTDIKMGNEYIRETGVLKEDLPRPGGKG